MAHRYSAWKIRAYGTLSSICILLGIFLKEVDSSKILIFSGRGDGSHYFAASSLAEELHHRGHSVSVLISSQFEYRSKQPPHGDMFDFRIVHGNLSMMTQVFQHVVTAAFEGKSPYRDLNILKMIGQELARECRDVFNTTVIEGLRRVNFDLLICDAVLPCTVLLGEYLSLEKVAIVPTSTPPYLIEFLGGAINPAVTTQLGSGYPKRMTFVQRLGNFLSFHLDSSIIMSFAELPYKDLLQTMNLKGYMESLKDINLYLVASDPIFDQKIPEMPGHVQTAGLTIREPKSLPQNLQEFVNSAGKDGVIIFSMGSYVTHMPEHLVEEFQEAFSRLPQKVIWRWINDEPPKNMPKNVKTMSWIPQMDLLGHKQIKLLFYHGGNNGIYEAIHFAVPVLVMPLMGDQLDVAQRAVESGIGLRIGVTDVTSDKIVECITNILQDPKYRENVERLSAIFRDRPQTPRERATFMIEHVLKFGSDHLRSPFHDLTFIQQNLIDVYLFLILSFISISYVLHIFLKIVFKSVRKFIIYDKIKR